MSMFLEVMKDFLHALPEMAGEVAIALSPIVALMIFFQVFYLKFPLRRFLRMCVGIVYTFLGLVLFLVGVNVGFQPAGTELGRQIGQSQLSWILIPIGLVLGFVIVFAEPAVAVLNQQVEKVSGGAISSRLMMIVLCVAMAIAVALGMIRVLTGLSIWWFILPGYGLALLLLKFSPPIFSAIAFDSGGVSSGPMTATFLLPFAVGASEMIAGSNPMTDAFGMVSMVAMMPLIAIQILGVIYSRGIHAQDLTEEDLAGLNDEDDDNEAAGEEQLPAPDGGTEV